jgi:hypothetical protein
MQKTSLASLAAQKNRFQLAVWLSLEAISVAEGKYQIVKGVTAKLLHGLAPSLSQDDVKGRVSEIIPVKLHTESSLLNV